MAPWTTGSMTEIPGIKLGIVWLFDKNTQKIHRKIKWMKKTKGNRSKMVEGGRGKKVFYCCFSWDNWNKSQGLAFISTPVRKVKRQQKMYDPNKQSDCISM